jgi:hypothetical protein
MVGSAASKTKRMWIRITGGADATHAKRQATSLPQPHRGQARLTVCLPAGGYFGLSGFDAKEVIGRTMAEFKTIVPVLKVVDLQRAVDFYTSILGFTVCWRAANDGGGENCMLAAGATNLLLSTASHLGDKPQLTGTLYFNMVGVRELFEQIKNRVEIAWPLETMDYGQVEFGIRSCDGYTLAFSEAET